MVIENDDDNKVFNIAFRTHSKEQHRCCTHSGTQCTFADPEDFPLKDPFVEPGKRGFFEYILNAMTYPDKTCYPVASSQ